MKLISWKVVAPLVIIWLLVCPIFVVVDYELTVGRVQRWMRAEGIAVGDIIDTREIQVSIVYAEGMVERPAGDLFIKNRDYVINEELYETMLEVAFSPHELLLLWDYQRGKYQRPIGIGLTAITLLMLIVKELVDAKGKKESTSIHM